VFNLANDLPSPLEVTFGEPISGIGTLLEYTNMLSGSGNPTFSSDPIALDASSFLHYDARAEGVTGCIYGKQLWSATGPVDGASGMTPFSIFIDYRGAVNGNLGSEGLKTNNVNYWRTYLTSLGFNNYWTTDDGVYYTLANLNQDGLETYTPPAAPVVPVTSRGRALIETILRGADPELHRVPEALFVSGIDSYIDTSETIRYFDTPAFEGVYKNKGYSGGYFSVEAVLCAKTAGIDNTASINGFVHFHKSTYNMLGYTGTHIFDAKGFGVDPNYKKAFIDGNKVYTDGFTTSEWLSKYLGITQSYAPASMWTTFILKTLVDRDL